MLAAIVGVWGLPAAAVAHVERPAYWPLPGADCSVHPCAGGAVPEARSLASAVATNRGSKTRVVCQPDSMLRLTASIAQAGHNGYNIRPTDHRSFSAAEAAQLDSINRTLFDRCTYHEIQSAVSASHNNDRVVIMPGVYTEPTARRQPTNDSHCARDKIAGNMGGDIVGAVSYPYQVHCPNDQNLIAVIGRSLGAKHDPHPPPVDRHGIPNLGKCIRCNLQIEGSGVSADDVVIEAGDPAASNGGPSAAGHAKDVGVRIDRADGAVLRNVTVRHAKEHDIYVLESNGYLLDSFKAFYAGEYGVLTFVEDHGLIQNCEAAGSGDSGLYPGAGAKTSAGRNPAFYPESRYSQEMRFCDSHHNSGGYSGTDGSATYIHHNNFYDNALGFTTDVFTAPGHPGFPQQGDLIEYNNFYANNFNPYVKGSDVTPSIAAPVGTGLWIAGGNDNVVRYNHFYDNWRRGVMLFAVPDATVCGPIIGSKIPVAGCDMTRLSTSYNDHFYGNIMGLSPSDEVAPNGTDFWWDAFPTNAGNCWWSNLAAPGRSITSSPAWLPNCGGGSNPSASLGLGDLVNELELMGCLAGFQLSGYPAGNPTLCTWAATPPKPETAQAGVAERQLLARAQRILGVPQARARLCQLFGNHPAAPC